MSFRPDRRSMAERSEAGRSGRVAGRPVRAGTGWRGGPGTSGAIPARREVPIGRPGRTRAGAMPAGGRMILGGPRPTEIRGGRRSRLRGSAELKPAVSAVSVPIRLGPSDPRTATARPVTVSRLHGRRSRRSGRASGVTGISGPISVRSRYLFARLSARRLNLSRNRSKSIPDPHVGAVSPRLAAGRSFLNFPPGP